MPRRLSVIATTLLVLVLALELLCRVLPVSTSTETGYHHDPNILNYPARHAWWTSTGWDLRNAQHLQSNNLGFAAQRDFIPDARAVALVGDSYVEASMLAPAQRPGMQLEQALQGRPVYAMGGPGSSLLDYADRMRLAHDRLQVRDIVVMLEAGDLRQSICGSGNVHSACLAPDSLQPRREHQPAPGLAKRLLRHSALAQYLASQLRFQPQQLLAPLLQRLRPAGPAGGDAGKPARLDARATKAVIDEFLSRIGPSAEWGLVLFVVDGRRTPQAQLEDGMADERQAFMAAARAWGADVLDAEEIYFRHHAESRRSLSVGPYDGHLNALGVQQVFTAAAQRLPARP